MDATSIIENGRSASAPAEAIEIRQLIDLVQDVRDRMEDASEASQAELARVHAEIAALAEQREASQRAAAELERRAQEAQATYDHVLALAARADEARAAAVDEARRASAQAAELLAERDALRIANDTLTTELGRVDAMRLRAEEALEGAMRAYAELRDDGRRSEQDAQRRAGALLAQQRERDAKIARLTTALTEARDRAAGLTAERAELDASLARAHAEIRAFAAEREQRELQDQQDDALTAALLERIAAARAAAEHDVEEQEALIDGFYRSRAWRLRERLGRVTRRRAPVPVRSSKPG